MHENLLDTDLVIATATTSAAKWVAGSNPRAWIATSQKALLAMTNALFLLGPAGVTHWVSR